MDIIGAIEKLKNEKTEDKEAVQEVKTDGTEKSDGKNIEVMK